jgi:ADP-ribosylglycohydrolase
MLGAIAGDIIGSVFENDPIKTTFFPLFHLESQFTDDTVLTVALAESILDGTPYVRLLKRYFRAYPHAGYGAAFYRWARSDRQEPYNSFGNGSAMRVAPVGFAYDTLDQVLDQARRSAEVTHDHPEGVKGAQAVAVAVFLARTGHSKEQIRDAIATRFAYNLDRTLADVRPRYAFDVTCQGSVPEAILAFLESTSFEGAIRNAISLGGDSDTQACIAGGIAHAFYGEVPTPIAQEVYTRLDDRLAAVTRRFLERFSNPRT